MTITSSGSNIRTDVVSRLNALLADSFALYLKTKNFHWHLSGPHFRDYHLLFDDQASQIFATTDVIAERVRKLGGQTLSRSADRAPPAHRRQRGRRGHGA
jgi:starvation-inducible DNA-binding protein